MQRDIDCCGCEFRVDYEWDDNILCVERVTINDNDLTDLLTEKVIDQIRDTLYGKYAEDMAEKAEWRYEMRRYA